MTSQGHPWAIYDRAIKAGSLAGAVAAAHNLTPPIIPDQALRLLLLYLRHDPGRYPRAAARWAASAATQTPTLTIGGLADLTDALTRLANDPLDAAGDLAGLAAALGLPDLRAVLREGSRRPTAQP